MDEPSEIPPTVRRRWPRVLAWVLLPIGLVLAIAVAWYVVRLHELRVERDAAIDRLRSMGGPVLPEDIVEPTRPGADPVSWLRRAKAFVDATSAQRFEPWEAPDAEQYRELLVVARAQPAGSEAARAVLAFDAALRRARPDAEDAETLEQALAGPCSARLDAIAEEGEDGLGRAWLRALVACGAEACELAEEARGLRPLVARDLDALRAADVPPMGIYEVYPLLVLQNELLHRMRLRALEGDVESALHDLRSLQALADVVRSPSSAIQFDARVLLMARAVTFLEEALDRLPSGAEVDDVVLALEAETPRADAVRAMKNQAAWANACYAWLEGGRTTRALPVDVDAVLLPLACARSQVVGLAHLDARIAIVSEPAWKRAIEPRIEYGRLEQPAEYLDPTLHVEPDAVDGIEANLALALVALENYRSGTAAAIALCERSIDPFTGAPLRHADDGERWSAWSPGVARSASPPEEDPTIRVRMKKR